MKRRAIPFLFAWLAAMPAVMPDSMRARAEEPQSFTVTTDTLAYCVQLQKQVTDRHSQIPEVQRLLAEGAEMCARGEVRGGIRHLRHALVMLHHRRAMKDGAPKPAVMMKPPPAPVTAPQQ